MESALSISEKIRDLAHTKISGKIYSFLSNLYTFGCSLRVLGWRQSIQVWKEFRIKQEDKPIESSQELLPIKATSLLHTFYLRRGSTDAAAVLFTLVRQAYGRYLPQREVKYMLDLGANVGCTTVWFLSRFPKAKLIAVEPDPSNFEILKKNCAPYGDRALLLQAAVWPRQARLSMTANEALDAVQVFESPDGDCLGMPISAILERFGFPQLDILISNIEGAERDMFSIDADAWIERTQFMAVSTHGPDCLRRADAYKWTRLDICKFGVKL